MDINLSEAGLCLLRRRLIGERVPVTDQTRSAYSELAEAGFAEPVHTFTKGRDSLYRLTKMAMGLNADLISSFDLVPSPEESVASPR